MVVMVAELVIIGIFIVSLVQGVSLRDLPHKRLADLNLNEILLGILLVIVFTKVLLGV